MGFWDENPAAQGGGGAFLDKDAKRPLIENGIPFPVVAVSRGDNPFEDGERYVVDLELDSDTLETCGLEPTEDEEGDDAFIRKLSFTAGAVESRDRACDLMAKWLDDPSNDPILAKLVKVGRSILLVPADAEVEAKPAAKAKPAAAKRAPARKRTTAKK